MSGHLQDRQLDELDRMDERSRAELLSHVRGCPDCRARWAAADPSRLFATLALAPLDADSLDALSARVDRAIERETAQGRRVRLYGVASIAASLLLAVLIGGFLVDGDPAPPQPAPTAAFEPAAADDPWSGVELVSSPGEAQVVDLTIGETRVVMIFDEALDL